MECGHAFCYDCWREYLKERISAGSVTGEGGSVVRGCVMK